MTLCSGRQSSLTYGSVELLEHYGFSYLSFPRAKNDRVAVQKKLDYTKPILTNDDAIVCPVALLFDMRENRGLPAVYRLYESFVDRTEKAEALGCAVLQGGIPVHAQRMPEPLDDFLSISNAGLGAGLLFTRESQLKNADVVPATTSQTQSESQRVEQTTENQQKLIDQISPDAETRLRGSFDVARKEFQQEFPRLEKPAPNLRWFGSEKGDTDSLRTHALVTPDGPCVALLANGSSYTVTDLDISPDRPSAQGQLWRSFSSRAAANEFAYNYCLDRYSKVEKGSPEETREDHLWFPPEGVVAESATASPDVTPAPLAQAERKAARTADLGSGGSDSSLRWKRQADGQTLLIGASGTCAILTPVTREDGDHVRLSFTDGTMPEPLGREITNAMEAALRHCQAVPASAH